MGELRLSERLHEGGGFRGVVGNDRGVVLKQRARGQRGPEEMGRV